MKRIALLLLCLCLVFPAFAQKKIIYPPGFPTAGPYSPGVLVDGTLYIAGQIGADVKTNKRPDAFADEVRVTLDRIGMILKAADMDYSNVVNVNVYLTDISMFQQMNEVYTTYFKSDRPARATVQATLVGGARIEISAVAKK